jgi:ADP-heptose:LPS heptosyltransferase
MRLKRLERWWRTLWIRILVRLMRRRTGAKPAWDARPHRVLFLRHDRAGDMILSTGVMRSIARSHPTIALDVLASPANAAIIRSSDFISRVVVFDKRTLRSYLATLRTLRRARYDAVIDCMVTAPSLTTLLLILASRARHRVGIAGRGNDAAFDVTVPPEARANAHMVDLLGALAAAFGVEPMTIDKRPVLDLTVEERERAESIWRTSDPARRVLINVSAGTLARRWSESRYVAVMRHIRRRESSASFRVIAAPSERLRGQQIAREGGGAFVDTPSIRDAFALVAAADFVFTPDTSIAHAASAFGTPCVAMYVRGSAERWGLYRVAGESVEHPEPTLDSLTAERMIRAVDAVWDATMLRFGR